MYKTTMIVVALVMLTIGCVSKNYNETKEFENTITHVSADIDSASIHVRPTNSGTTSVEVVLEYWGRAPDFEASVDDTTLRVELDCNPSCDGKIVLLVPEGISLYGDIGSGNMLVENIDGDITASSRSGNIQVENTVGNLELETESGNVLVENIDGDITASSRSGNIQVENTVGNLDLETGSGDVTGHSLSSVSCLADSSSGTVNLSFDEIPSDVNMETGSGNIKLTVPYGSYDVDWDTESGNTSIEGLIEDPDSPNSIRTDTGSGNVTIQGR